MENEIAGPLSGITIIDCTMVLSGPFATMILADLGANVIKVEPPYGDGARRVAPVPPDYVSVAKGASESCDYGAYFGSVNRNKRSIVLDLKQEEDREVFLKLCDTADAVTENLRSGVMDDLGIGYEVIKARNPQIVYGCIRGFGDPRTGESPYRDWPSYDVIAQAMAGHVHITGPRTSKGYPAGAAIGDVYPGTLLATGMIAALFHAQKTGEGQFVDVAMYDGMLALAHDVVSLYGFGRMEMERRDLHHPASTPFGIYEASDGSVAIAAPDDKHWAILCEVMERPDLLSDSRMKNKFSRGKNHEYLEEEISKWTRSLTKSEVMSALGGKVPCGPVNTGADIFSDPHVYARDMIVEFTPQGDNPPVSIVGCPIKFSKTPSGVYSRPPKLGEHTEEILSELGLLDN